MDIANFNLNSPIECQNALDLNERFIHRYLELLDQYVLLPGYEELIATTLKKEFPKDFLDSIDSFTYLPPPGDPNPGQESPMAGYEDAEPPPEPEEAELPDAELPPSMQKIRDIEQRISSVQSIIYQLILDWCNLYAAVLPHERRIQGMQILTSASLVLAYTRSALDQISLFQYVMCQQLIGKAMEENRFLMELLGTLQREVKQLSSLFAARMDSLRTIEPTLAKLVEDFQLLQNQGDPEDF